MPSSVVGLQILLILLPGFAASYIAQLLAVRAKQSDFDKTIEALLFSFVIYVSYHVIRRGEQPVTFPDDPKSGLLFHPGNLVWLTLLTLVFAFILVLYVNKDGALLFRWLKITERTSRSSIWNDTFQDVQQTKNPADGSIVQIELEDGRSVMGIVQFYSDFSDECSVFLRNAQWIGEGNKIVEINGPGILLTRNAKITSISFLDPQTVEDEVARPI